MSNKPLVPEEKVLASFDKLSGLVTLDKQVQAFQKGIEPIVRVCKKRWEVEKKIEEKKFKAHLEKLKKTRESTFTP